MRRPLLLDVLAALRRARKALTPEARHLVIRFLRTQQSGHAYINAGGKADAYYTQFGVLCSVMLGEWQPWKVLYLLRHHGRMQLDNRHSVSRKEPSMYDRFFASLTRGTRQDLQSYRTPEGAYANESQRMVPNTNATCCALCLMRQEGMTDRKAVEWLKGMQQPNGGFTAQQEAPVPDLLSTAVALFTLRLLGEKPQYPAADLVDAHWMADGGFMPTLMDEYSDSEYVFYGLLAIGSLNDDGK